MPDTTIDPSQSQEQQLEQARQRIADLEAQLEEKLSPKPAPPPTADALMVMFFDELVGLLGSHPRLDELWQKLRPKFAAKL